jgi:hypothetical protein
MSVAALMTAAFSDPLSITITSLSALGAAAGLADEIASGSSFSSIVDDLAQMAVQPMVGLIPIRADQYKESLQVETPESMVISAQSKQFITDSAAPHPRVWKIHGYLKSLIPALEASIIIKPTVLLQKSYLKNAAKSRTPILFKTTEGEFVSVLIQNLEFTEDPKCQNTAAIDITVKEFEYLVAEIAVGASDLTSSAKAAAASVPSFMSAVNAQSIPAILLSTTIIAANGIEQALLNPEDIAHDLGAAVFPLPIIKNENTEEQVPIEDYSLSVSVDPDSIIQQTIDGSTAYMIPLPAAGEAWRVIVSTSCGEHGFRFDIRWSYTNQKKFDSLMDIIEKKRQQTNVLELHFVLPPSPVPVISKGTIHQPEDFRTFVENNIAFYDALLSFDASILNAIKSAMDTQPFSEPDAKTIFTWFLEINTVVQHFKNIPFAPDVVYEAENILRQCLYLWNLFKNPPKGGLIDYIYTHPSLLPNFTKVIVYLQKNYLRLRETFARLDAAFAALNWLCTAYAPSLGTPRTFSLKPLSHLFKDDDKYNISITSDMIMGNGNVGADQLNHTALIIEILP